MSAGRSRWRSEAPSSVVRPSGGFLVRAEAASHLRSSARRRRDVLRGTVGAEPGHPQRTGREGDATPGFLGLGSNVGVFSLSIQRNVAFRSTRFGWTWRDLRVPPHPIESNSPLTGPRSSDDFVGPQQERLRDRQARAFAVFLLMTSSNVVGSSTGRSAGSAPLRILSVTQWRGSEHSAARPSF